MNVEQIYTKCLAQGAYYIESNGEAAVIDPLRETSPYLNRLHSDGAKVKYIFETHFHADFVSGHVDLAKDTGATIVFGPEAAPEFPFHSAKDQEVFKVGDLSIKVLHTPGHTMESTCYLLSDKSGRDLAVFTGDTLFIGDVGRPDLVQKAATMTQEDLAGKLFDSLRNKLMTLADDVVVYPAHGAGSACGKNMSKETTSTIGEQKALNYALRADMTKEEFVDEVTDGLMPAPQYFGMNVAMNKKGYDPISEVMKRGNTALSIGDFTDLSSQSDVLILDTREATDFSNGFISGSIFIGLEGQFAPWVGALISTDNQKIILVTDTGKEEEAVQRLARVGYDNVLGFLQGGISSWIESGGSTEKLDRLNVTEFSSLDLEKECVIDVRKPGEHDASHLTVATSLPLDYIGKNLPEYPVDKPLILHCAGGYRSLIAASILKKNGIKNVRDLIGGYNAIPENFSLKSDFVCPSKS
tara:strand:+ start:1816 stop:3222 length:1407 start_codon:yes stop_codon:yes gene_type:complete